MPTVEQIEQEIKAWNECRNAMQIGVDWQFTTADARIKRKLLYLPIKT